MLKILLSARYLLKEWSDFHETCMVDLLPKAAAQVRILANFACIWQSYAPLFAKYGHYVQNARTFLFLYASLNYNFKTVLGNNCIGDNCIGDNSIGDN